MKWENISDDARYLARATLHGALADARRLIDRGPPDAQVLATLTPRNAYHVLCVWDDLWDMHAGVLAAIDKLGGDVTFKEKYHPLDMSKRPALVHVEHVPERDGPDAQWRRNPEDPNHNLNRLGPWATDKQASGG